MQAHDEERDIYGAVYVQGKKYFLLENRPTRRDLWMVEGTSKWLVADEESVEFNGKNEKGDWNTFYFASYIVIGSDALIDLLPVPVVKKVIRFYVTDDEEA
jgi:hypothetical protein